MARKAASHVLAWTLRLALVVLSVGCGDSSVTVDLEVAGDGAPADSTPEIRPVDALYDLENTVTLEGRVFMVATPGNRSSLLVMGVEDDDGRTEMWAIESNTRALESTGGGTSRSIVPGTTLTVTAYLPKPDADLSPVLADRPGPPIDRVAHGAEAILPDGSSIVLGEIP